MIMVNLDVRQKCKCALPFHVDFEEKGVGASGFGPRYWRKELALAATAGRPDPEFEEVSGERQPDELLSFPTETDPTTFWTLVSMSTFISISSLTLTLMTEEGRLCLTLELLKFDVGACREVSLR
jgi:hypothetical protein